MNQQIKKLIFTQKQCKDTQKAQQEPSLSLPEPPASMNSLKLFEQLSQARSCLLSPLTSGQTVTSTLCLAMRGLETRELGGETGQDE